MIKKIQFSNFRNFDKKTLEFSDTITVIVGKNGVGKTNILESIFMISMGKSFKAKLEWESINYDENISRIIGEIGHEKLEVVLTKDVDGWPRKRLLINGVPKRLIDFAGNLKVVLFIPSHMDLVTSSPNLRRKFLDVVLSQTDKEYHRSILSYEKGLRMRNKLLFRIREEGVPRSQLLFWNQLLIKDGNYITDQREKFINFVNELGKVRLEYDKSEISEKRLEQYSREEVASATTLVGPHRDDFIFFDKEKKLDSYGSRGEQRMGVLWLKMAELNYIEAKTDVKPVLLLDDIFSELDHIHREIVIEVTKARQTIITTADEHFLEDFKKLDSKIIKL